MAVGIHNAILFPVQITGGGRPFPIARMGDKIRSDRILFDIASQAEQVICFCNGLLHRGDILLRIWSDFNPNQKTGMILTDVGKLLAILQSFQWYPRGISGNHRLAKNAMHFAVSH